MDITAAQDWYEGQLPGLGARFRIELDSTVLRIEANPLQFPVVFTGDVRRALVRDFPYGVFFGSEPEAVMVIACFHASRDPQHWQRRM